MREGIAGFRRTPFAAFATTTSIATALLLTGVFAFLTYEVQTVMNFLKQRVGEMEVFLQPLQEAEVQVLRTRLEAVPGVDSLAYISSAEAYAVFAAEFGTEATLFEGELFLPASFRIRLAEDFVVVDSLKFLRDKIQRLPGIDEVVFEEAMLLRIQENFRWVAAGGLGIASLVILAALFLVSNTIRLTIYARRLLIRTMKLVGATDAFVRRPFLIEGILQGLLGGILASIPLWILFTFVHQVVPGMRPLPTPHAALAAGSALLAGILIGWIGSFAAARRFIRKVSVH